MVSIAVSDISKIDIAYAAWLCRRTDTILGTCLEEWINVR